MYVIRNLPGSQPTAGLREPGKLANSSKGSHRIWQQPVHIEFYHPGKRAVGLRLFEDFEDGCGAELRDHNSDFDSARLLRSQSRHRSATIQEEARIVEARV
jgi:hypothetical protein